MLPIVCQLFHVDKTIQYVTECRLRKDFTQRNKQKTMLPYAKWFHIKYVKVYGLKKYLPYFRVYKTRLI